MLNTVWLWRCDGDPAANAEAFYAYINDLILAGYLTLDDDVVPF